jgi:UDP-N-acetylglucosamine--N-acetylmuramyl-(pentapeptide) pyrophosphoryl-undecaprenol N-acetylglucosamine transferase
MRLIVTGGGTGGHVYPALEVARFAKDSGAEVAYFGSIRGLEGQLCKPAQIPFAGFPSEPIYSVRTIKGLIALLKMGKARSMALRALRDAKADVVFGTGGYSAAPVISAAKALKVPYVLHEQNAVAGRTIHMLAPTAFAVATTFHAAQSQFVGTNIVRTGLPVRKELRAAAAVRKPELIPLILVVGGSQGAQSLNEAALGAAKRMVGRTLNWIHASGTKHFEDVYASFDKLGLKDSYQVFAFLDGAQMAESYKNAQVVVARAGAATLSELAAFRLPSVVCPYPHAYANHQYHNAKEFESFGGTQVIAQDDIHPAELEKRLCDWLDDPMKMQAAATALAKWDMPNASERIFELIQFAHDSKK